MDFEPKLSPVRGKYIQITGLFEIIGFLTFNSIDCVTLENPVYHVYAFRDAFRTKGWIKEKKERISMIKQRGIGVFVKAICSPFIAEKSRKEFEFKQKVTMLMLLSNEEEAMFIMSVLAKKVSITLYMMIIHGFNDNKCVLFLAWCTEPSIVVSLKLLVSCSACF